MGLELPEAGRVSWWLLIAAMWAFNALAFWDARKFRRETRKLEQMIEQIGVQQTTLIAWLVMQASTYGFVDVPFAELDELQSDGIEVRMIPMDDVLRVLTK